LKQAIVTGFLLLSLATTGHTMVLNGDFSNGLTGWTVEGDVSVSAGEEARLADDDPFFAVLYQGVPIQGTQLELDFDGSQLSSEVPPGVFTDFFTAALYFIDDLSLFSLDPVNPVFDDVIALFDIELGALSLHNGVLDPGCVDPSGTIVGTWCHFTLDFASVYNYAIPAFELVDGNFLVDSQVLVDNVQITTPRQAPLPGTLLLLAAGLVPLAWRAPPRARRLRGATET
jgi:hypothetical protein